MSWIDQFKDIQTWAPKGALDTEEVDDDEVSDVDGTV